MSRKCWGIPREHCSSIMAVIYHKRVLCSHWVMNDLSVPTARASGSLLMVGAGWGPFIMHYLAQSLPKRTPPGKYWKDQAKRKPSWVNYSSSKRCPNLLISHHSILSSLFASLSLFLPPILFLKTCWESLGISVRKSEWLHKNASNTDTFEWFLVLLLYRTASFCSFLFFSYMLVCIGKRPMLRNFSITLNHIFKKII